MAANMPTASPLDRHRAPTAGVSGGRATTAFILGIVGVTGAFLIPILGLVLGIVALAMVGRAKGASRPWKCTAAFWLGVASVVVSIINMVIAAAILTS